MCQSLLLVVLCCVIVSVCCLSARVNSCHSIFVVAFDSVSCGLIEVEITKDAPVLSVLFSFHFF